MTWNTPVLKQVRDLQDSSMLILDRRDLDRGLHAPNNKKTGPKKNGGRWLIRIIGAFYFKKTEADPGPQSSIAPPVAFFSRDDPDFAISYFLISCPKGCKPFLKDLSISLRI